MAKINLILRPKQNKDGTYPIIIKLRSGFQTMEIPIGFKVRKDQWNGQVIKHPDKELINARIADKLSEVNKYLNDCILKNKPVDLNSIGKPIASVYFTDYIASRVKAYQDSPQAGRVDYINKELLKLFGPLSFQEITADTLRKYHSFLLKDHGPNTIAKRIATLRQLFANAVNEGVYIGANPFSSFKVKKAPVKKEKLTVKEIAQIETAKVYGDVATARDMFLFAYYCKGIRFENCVLLQWKDIKNGRVIIKTNKGEKHLTVDIHPKLKSVLDRHRGKGFVFPYVDEIPKTMKEKRKTLDPINVIVNRNLKIVAAAAGINKNVSFHVSRHSLAYHLKQAGVGIGAIKDVLGHSDTATTEMYLQSLDDTALDKEMAKVYK